MSSQFNLPLVDSNKVLDASNQSKQDEFEPRQRVWIVFVKETFQFLIHFVNVVCWVQIYGLNQQLKPFWLLSLCVVVLKGSEYLMNMNMNKKEKPRNSNNHVHLTCVIHVHMIVLTNKQLQVIIGFLKVGRDISVRYANLRSLLYHVIINFVRFQAPITKGTVVSGLWYIFRNNQFVFVFSEFKCFSAINFKICKNAQTPALIVLTRSLTPPPVSTNTLALIVESTCWLWGTNSTPERHYSLVDCCLHKHVGAAWLMMMNSSDPSRGTGGWSWRVDVTV